MKNISRFRVPSIFFVMAYLLAACGGTLSQTAAPAKGPKVEANVVAFTGTVEAMNGAEWIVSGQKFTLDPQASLDPNIAVGDEVKVEARVSADGAVVATKIESSGTDDTVSTPSADDNGTPEPVSTSSPEVGETPDGNMSSMQDDSMSEAEGADKDEVFGTVEAITADTITVNGVTYDLTNSTESKDALTVGDLVKLHVTVHADGTVTVQEIEKSATSFGDNRSNSGGSNDGPNHNANDNKPAGNGNFSDDGSNHDSNDDHDGSGNSGSGGG